MTLFPAFPLLATNPGNATAYRGSSFLFSYSLLHGPYNSAALLQCAAGHRYYHRIEPRLKYLFIL